MDTLTPIKAHAHAAPAGPAPAPAPATQVPGSADPRPVAGASAAEEHSAGDDGHVAARREGQYSEQELARIRELQARDREVRAHERAHLAAAGPHARGGAHYTFETGPDRRRYAVGGEVQIDTSPVAGDPAATLTKALQVQRAALAPAEPSAQDRRVAAEAAAMAANARAELTAERARKNDPSATGTDAPAATIDLLA